MIARMKIWLSTVIVSPNTVLVSPEAPMNVPIFPTSSCVPGSPCSRACSDPASKVAPEKKMRAAAAPPARTAKVMTVRRAHPASAARAAKPAAVPRTRPRMVRSHWLWPLRKVAPRPLVRAGCLMRRRQGRRVRCQRPPTHRLAHATAWPRPCPPQVPHLQKAQRADHRRQDQHLPPPRFPRRCRRTGGKCSRGQSRYRARSATFDVDARAEALACEGNAAIKRYRVSAPFR